MNPVRIATIVAFLRAILFLSQLTVSAEAIPVQAQRAHYSVQVWQTEDGLPNNAVQALCQTPDGFLWLGTQNGLARFDGGNFTGIPLIGATNAKALVINALFVSRDGGLWIGSAAGQLTYWKDGKMQVYSCAGSTENTILSLCEDDDLLWVGTREGLRTFKNGKFTRFQGPHMLRTAPVRSLARDHTNRIWAAHSGGLACVTAEGVVTNYTGAQGLRNVYLRAVHCDTQGEIRAGSNEGLVMLKKSKFAFYTRSHGLPDNVVNALYKDSTGVLWIGTFGGLCRYSDGKFIPELNEKGDAFDQVFCFLEDHEGSLWVGAKDGLHRMNRRQFETLTTRHGLAHNNIISVMEDRSGSLWVGTWGGGLHQWKNDEWKIYNMANTPEMRSDQVLALFEGRDDSIWFSSDFDGSLYRLKEGVVRRYQDRKLQFGVISIRALHEDKQGRIWAGARNGLFQMDGKKITRFSETNGLPNQNVRCFAEDGESLWIGTEGGLTLFRTNTFKTFTTADGLPNDTVLALHLDREKNLWIGTARGGLVCRKNGTFYRCSSHYGLASDDVLEFLDDGHRLWMASSRGVFHVEKQDLHNLFDGRASNVKCVSYGRADGMVSSVCVGVAKPSAIRTHDGTFWFATTKGIAVTNPKLHLEKNTVAPSLAIHTVVADLQHVHSSTNRSGQQEFILPPGRGEVEFHYSALSFRAPEKNLHKYQLTGVDRGWVDAGNRRVAYYNNLAPGIYTFRVIGSNNDQVWNEKGAAITITLQSHFWQTSWFAGAVALACLGFVGGSARYVTRRRMQARLRRLEQQHTLERERHRIAKDIHDDVGASLTQIGLLSEMVKRDIGERDQALVHTAKISDTAQELVLAMDEIVWAVNPKNDNLRRLAGYVFKFAEEFLTVSGVQCRIEQPESFPEIPLSAEVRHNVFLVVKEALNNIVKHSRATEVWLRLKIERGELDLTIEDNGCGFRASPVDIFGNGLSNMKKRMDDIGGKFEQTSEPGSGTKTRLHILLR